MSKQRVFAEIFGLGVRLVGLWIVFQGFLFLRVVIMAGMGGLMTSQGFWLGVIPTIVGLGILRCADDVVRFSYRRLTDSDTDGD